MKVTFTEDDGTRQTFDNISYIHSSDGVYLLYEDAPEDMGDIFAKEHTQVEMNLRRIEE